MTPVNFKTSVLLLVAGMTIIPPTLHALLAHRGVPLGVAAYGQGLLAVWCGWIFAARGVNVHALLGAASAATSQLARIWPPIAFTIWLILVLASACFLFPDALAHAAAPDTEPGQSVVLLCLVAPIVEEIAFRGLLLSGLLQRMGARPAILLTSLAFDILHPMPLTFVPAAMSLILCLLYLRTGSLVLCMVAHGVANGLGMEAEPAVRFLLAHDASRWPVVGAAAAGAIVMLRGLVRFLRDDTPYVPPYAARSIYSE